MSVSLTGAGSAQRSSLEIPLDSGHIFTARLFAGGVARSLELDDETADALRLVLTEVCSEAIERWGDGRIAIEIVADADRVRAAIVATGSPDGDAHGEGVDATYRRTLIEALAPDVTFVEERASSNVTFTLPTV